MRKPSVVRVESNAESGPLQEGDTFHLTCRVLTDSASHGATMLVWRGDTLVAPDDPRVTLRAQRTRNLWQLSIANVTRADAGRWVRAGNGGGTKVPQSTLAHTARDLGWSAMSTNTNLNRLEEPLA